MSIRKKTDILLSRFERQFTTHNSIEVSRSALVHNALLFEKLSHSAVIPVLKGNAYGHGIELVATALKRESFPYIAVDGYFEALRIREVSKQPVLVMGAIFKDNYARMKYDDFAFVVQDEAAIRALSKTGKHIRVHLECNTGMNRYGAAPKEMAELASLIAEFPHLELEGIMSHLADSDGSDPKTVNNAVEAFDTAVEAVLATGAKPKWLHIAQSAGSLKAHSRYANAMRLGIGLYGINPFPADHPIHDRLSNLRPALQLISTITKVTTLEKGDKVSYNYTFTAPHAMRIGVLPLGYYEGLNRALSNVGSVKIDSTLLPIVGRVCMNHTMVNLENTKALVGDRVIVYSNNPRDENSIDAIATKHGLFSYNLLTALSPDIRRILVD